MNPDTGEIRDFTETEPRKRKSELEKAFQEGFTVPLTKTQAKRLKRQSREQRKAWWRRQN